MKKNNDKDHPAIRPDQKTCNACEYHDICLAEAGHMNYRCPKMK